MRAHPFPADQVTTPRMRPWPPNAGAACRAIDAGSLADREFAEMHETFARHGGLAHEDALVQRLRLTVAQPISVLARWIVDRAIVSLRWRGRTLVPMFQFEDMGTTLHAATRDIVRELTDVFDDRELCLWFAQRNAWLAGARPVELVRRDPRSVHEAARADRFVARG